jgi:hypothetical protein
VKETGTEVVKGFPEPSLTVMLTPALPPAEIVAGEMVKALKLRFGGVTERPIVAETAVPEASVVSAVRPHIVLPNILPNISPFVV